jgi:hypothetical protein
MNAKPQTFHNSGQSLEQVLKASRPGIKMPTGLHDAIMDEVRSAVSGAAQRTVHRPGLVLFRWISAPALAAVALGAFLLLRPDHNQSGPSPMPIRSALSPGDDAARTLPSAVIAPLSDELAKVNLDLENTAHHLLASLP